MSINETRREAIINKLKELEEFLEPEGAHFVLHLFTSRDVTEESYSLYNNCSLKILAMSQARIENYIEQLGKISLKHHKENVEMMKLVDKLIESITIWQRTVHRARGRHDRTIEGFKGRTKRRRQQEKFI